MKTIQRITVLLFVGALFADAASHKRDLQRVRDKRSLGWLFGGGESQNANEDSDNDSVEEQPPPIVYGPYPDASIASSIVNQGRIVNNEVHYPIWRVHKYNGLHLAPIPVSLIHSGNGQPNPNFPAEHRLPSNTQETVFNGQNSYAQVSDAQLQNHLTQENPSSSVEYPAELVELAHQFGITDLSQFPSLDEAANLLGTTTQEETIKTIKEIAATDDGRNLIRSFIGGQNASDNEVAASEPLENVAAEEEEEGVESREIDGAATTSIGQYVLPNGQSGNIYSYLPLLGVGGEPEQQQQVEPEVVERSGNDEADENEPSTPNPGVFDRLQQWGNFLNPFANREEIPIPPSESDDDDTVVVGSSGPATENEYTLNQRTFPLPNLPELPQLPRITGVSHVLPELPNVHIPTRYVPPAILNTFAHPNGASHNGAYIRVKLPLAGFNPTPQIPVDPTYLHHAQNQLERHRKRPPPQVSQQPYAPAQPVNPAPVTVSEGVSLGSASQTPIQPIEKPHVPHQTYIAPTEKPQVPHQTYNVPTEKPHVPHHTYQAVPPPKPIQHLQAPHQVFFVPTDGPFASSVNHPAGNLQLPPVHAIAPFRQSFQPIVPNPLPQSSLQFQQPRPVQAITNIGQLPLIHDANYEVFKNAPRPQIVTSYGTPALPYSYNLDGSPSSYQPLLASSGAYNHHELQPAASEVDERSQPQNIENNEEIVAQPNQTIEEEAEEAEEANQEVVARENNDNEGVVAAEAAVESQSDEIPVEQEAESDIASFDKFYNLEGKQTDAVPVVLVEQLVAEAPNTAQQQTKTSHIQRITPHNAFATGKVHKADPKAMEMLPFTVRRMVDNEQQMNRQ